jgi:hypothetical protein
MDRAFIEIGRPVIPDHWMMERTSTKIQNSHCSSYCNVRRVCATTLRPQTQESITAGREITDK